MTERFSVDLENVSKIDAELVSMIQTKINEQKSREQRKMKQKMQGVTQ